MNRILITGGAGFVGSSLALRLKEAYPSAEVLCLDNLYRRGSEYNRDRIREQGLTFVEADVRDASSFEMDPCDLVIDAAAEPSVMAGKKGDSAYVVDTNLGGTLHVLEAARKWSAALVFLSSSRIYPVDFLRGIKLEESETRFEIAGGQSLPGVTAAGISEASTGAGARTLYGATKYASEVMVTEYSAQFGIKSVINRCGVLAGPWQMGNAIQGIVAFWVAAHHFAMPVSYIGYGGKQVRDILHIEDLADLLLMQLSALDAGDRWCGETYNIGGGRKVSASLLELTELCQAATGKTLSIPAQETTRDGDIPLYVTDTALAREVWGWQPRRSAADIVETTAKWLSEKEDLVREVFVG